jgi:hypothetical protein
MVYIGFNQRSAARACGWNQSRPCTSTIVPLRNGFAHTGASQNMTIPFLISRYDLLEVSSEGHFVIAANCQLTSGPGLGPPPRRVEKKAKIRVTE